MQMRKHNYIYQGLVVLTTKHKPLYITCTQFSSKKTSQSMILLTKYCPLGYDKPVTIHYY